MAEDLLCFSHLRWNFVFQRPNHLMSRFALERRVFFIEEAIADSEHAWLEYVSVAPNLERVIPHVKAEGTWLEQTAATAKQLAGMCEERQITRPVHWFYTPMMLGLAADLPRSMVVYDCMDELRHFLNAPSDIARREQLLLSQADLVFTGGMALYEAKQTQHPNVHPVPSSVDFPFFRQARYINELPADVAHVPGPRVGFCGVIDERMDLSLIEKLATRRPAYQILMVGPVVKIDPASLPRRINIHYLGARAYDELPNYLACWDVAIMPFALNDATRFISPTKTPEYLAAGKPVVSTAIRDVVEPYGRRRLVRIGYDAEEFIAHVDAFVEGRRDVSDSVRDEFLSGLSWDATWQRMRRLMEQTHALNPSERLSQPKPAVSHV